MQRRGDPHPRADGWGSPEPSETAKQVHVSDVDAWTGLYDANGRKLVRVKEPFGFVPK